MINANSEEIQALQRFAVKRDGEEIEFVLRRSPITLLPLFGALAFLTVVPMFVFMAVVPYDLRAFLQPPYRDIYFLAATLFYGFIWIIAAIEWSNYYLDIFMVTNRRLMSIQQKGLFYRVVSELELENLQDITSSVKGPIQTLFDFGDLQIQTASEESRVNPHAIPHPVAVRRRIMELCTARDEHGHHH